MSGAHFVFLGVEAVLLYISGFGAVMSLLLSSLFGLSIEINQLGIMGRSADPIDWALDTLGALAFLYILKKLQSNQSR